MGFKDFLAEMKEAYNEGRAEAREEYEQKQAEGQAEVDAAAEAFEQTSAGDRFAVALGAPYRALFVGDLDKAVKDGRPEYTLCTFFLPAEKKAELPQYLERDFDVVDAATLTQEVASLEAALYTLILSGILDRVKEGDGEAFATVAGHKEALEEALQSFQIIAIGDFNQARQRGDGDFSLIRDQRAKLAETCAQLHIDFPAYAALKKDLLALWMARISYMVSGAVGLEYIAQGDAEDYLSGVTSLGVPLFASWEEYAEAYLRGEKTDKTNNALGRKILESNTKALLSKEESPWKVVPWPVPSGS